MNSQLFIDLIEWHQAFYEIQLYLFDTVLGYWIDEDGHSINYEKIRSK